MRARRRQLLALPMAAFWVQALEVLAAGSVEKGIHRIRGDVRVNDAPAREGQDVKAGDVIVTGRASEAVFVAGRDAFLVRENSRVEAQGAAGTLLLSGLRIVTGAVLSVFVPGETKTLRTHTAIVGIRGTAVYVEADPERSYVCTCYGEAEIVSAADPSVREIVRTTRHEQPRYVMGAGAPRMLVGAPVINHTDAELTFLEELVGRRPGWIQYPGDETNRY